MSQTPFGGIASARLARRGRPIGSAFAGDRRAKVPEHGIRHESFYRSDKSCASSESFLTDDNGHSSSSSSSVVLNKEDDDRVDFPSEDATTNEDSADGMDMEDVEVASTSTLTVTDESSELLNALQSIDRLELSRNLERYFEQYADFRQALRDDYKRLDLERTRMLRAFRLYKSMCTPELGHSTGPYCPFLRRNLCHNMFLANHPLRAEDGQIPTLALRLPLPASLRYGPFSTLSASGRSRRLHRIVDAIKQRRLRARQQQQSNSEDGSPSDRPFSVSVIEKCLLVRRPADEAEEQRCVALWNERLCAYRQLLWLRLERATLDANHDGDVATGDGSQLAGHSASHLDSTASTATTPAVQAANKRQQREGSASNHSTAGAKRSSTRMGPIQRKERADTPPPTSALQPFAGSLMLKDGEPFKVVTTKYELDDCITEAALRGWRIPQHGCLQFRGIQHHAVPTDRTAQVTIYTIVEEAGVFGQPVIRNRFYMPARPGIRDPIYIDLERAEPPPCPRVGMEGRDHGLHMLLICRFSDLTVSGEKRKRAMPALPVEEQSTLLKGDASTDALWRSMASEDEETWLGVCRVFFREAGEYSESPLCGLEMGHGNVTIVEQSHLDRENWEEAENLVDQLITLGKKLHSNPFIKLSVVVRLFPPESSDEDTAQGFSEEAAGATADATSAAADAADHKGQQGEPSEDLASQSASPDTRDEESRPLPSADPKMDQTSSVIESSHHQAPLTPAVSEENDDHLDDGPFRPYVEWSKKTDWARQNTHLMSLVDEHGRPQVYDKHIERINKYMPSASSFTTSLMDPTAESVRLVYRFRLPFPLRAHLARRRPEFLDALSATALDTGLFAERLEVSADQVAKALDDVDGQSWFEASPESDSVDWEEAPEIARMTCCICQRVFPDRFSLLLHLNTAYPQLVFSYAIRRAEDDGSPDTMMVLVKLDADYDGSYEINFPPLERGAYAGQKQPFELGRSGPAVWLVHRMTRLSLLRKVLRVDLTAFFEANSREHRLAMLPPGRHTMPELISVLDFRGAHLLSNVKNNDVPVWRHITRPHPYRVELHKRNMADFTDMTEQERRFHTLWNHFIECLTGDVFQKTSVAFQWAAFIRLFWDVLHANNLSGICVNHLTNKASHHLISHRRSPGDRTRFSMDEFELQHLLNLVVDRESCALKVQGIREEVLRVLVRNVHFRRARFAEISEQSQIDWLRKACIRLPKSHPYAGLIHPSEMVLFPPNGQAPTFVTDISQLSLWDEVGMIGPRRVPRRSHLLISEVDGDADGKAFERKDTRPSNVSENPSTVGSPARVTLDEENRTPRHYIELVASARIEGSVRAAKRRGMMVTREVLASTILASSQCDDAQSGDGELPPVKRRRGRPPLSVEERERRAQEKKERMERELTARRRRVSVEEKPKLSSDQIKTIEKEEEEEDTGVEERQKDDDDEQFVVEPFQLGDDDEVKVVEEHHHPASSSSSLSAPTLSGDEPQSSCQTSEDVTTTSCSDANGGANGGAHRDLRFHISSNASTAESSRAAD